MSLKPNQYFTSVMDVFYAILFYIVLQCKIQEYRVTNHENDIV